MDFVLDLLGGVVSYALPLWPLYLVLLLPVLPSLARRLLRHR